MSDKSWVIPNIPAVPTFLRAVSNQVSGAITISFEIYRPPSDVNLVYLQHGSNTGYRPWRDTILPRTRVYFCDLNRALISDLTRLLKVYEPRKVFWHIKGFVEGNLVFWIHDADMEVSALISPKISSAAVRAIALSVKRAPARIDSNVDWDADWKEFPEKKKRRKASARS
jgi:hypothetical protein